MKMILKTMVCLAVAFSGTAGAANYSPEKSQASLALKVPGIRLWNIRLLSVNYRIVISIMSGKQKRKYR